MRVGGGLRLCHCHNDTGEGGIPSSDGDDS